MSLLSTKSANYGAFNNLTVGAGGGGQTTTNLINVQSTLFEQPPRYDDSETVTIRDTDYAVVTTQSNSTYFQLPDATTCAGRKLILRNNSGDSIYSTDNNVALPGAGDKYDCINSIIAYGNSQAWAELVSDGTYWVLVRGYAQAYCGDY